MTSHRRLDSRSREATAEQSCDGAVASDIAFLDLTTQYRRLKPTIDARIQAVLDHGAFVNGPEIEELEAALSERAGGAVVVGVGSGTDALHIALMAEGIGPGDAVFVPSFTYLATANAVLLTGARPVFADVEAATFMLNVDHLDACIEKVRRSGQVTPRAIIAVDLFGLPANYPAIMAVAERHELLVIADAAQSFGAGLDGRPVGALVPATTTSFFPSKSLGGYGDGGALFTMDPERAARWRSIRMHGTGDDRMLALRSGLNSRLDSIQAAVLLAKLELFDEELATRERLARLYDERLSETFTVRTPPPNARGAFTVYAILTDERDRIRGELEAAGIPTAIYYPHPLHTQPAFREASVLHEPLPVAEMLSERVLNLPLHPYLLPDSVHHICDLLLDSASGRVAG